MAERALPDISVLDLSLEIGGVYCTKLLADLGAVVTMVEPVEGGHPLRHLGPFKDGAEGPDGGGLFHYLCANKRSVALDLGSPKGRAEAQELASQADLVVESFPPGRMASLGLGYEALRVSNPRVVLTSVSYFGQTGPYRDWQGGEIVEQALGGYMYFGGHPDREPLMVPNNQPQLHAGMQAAIASMAALQWARSSGKGQHVDVSAVEAMLSAHCWTSTSWSHMGQVVRRAEPDCIPCKDGYIFIMGLRHNPDLFLMLERPELIEDLRFRDRESWTKNMNDLWGIVREWCLEHTKEEIFHGGQELLLPVTPVYNAADLTRSAQLEARKWFLDVEHPVVGTTTLPGYPYKFSETPPLVYRPAPALGQDAGPPPPRAKPPAPSRKRPPLVTESGDGPDLPLSGIRILEVTANWAGPLAGRHLADLGAEHIKVEPSDRLMSRRDHYAGDQPVRYFYNRSAYFNKLNRNKYGVTLHLSSPRGRELFLRMVKEADVVLENNSPRVMRNFDLEYPVMKEVNPKIIMLSISGFGHDGPHRDYVAYGANIEASCGLAAVTGYADDDRPYRTGMFYADPVTAGHASFAILAALSHRARTGQGQHIEMTLQEAGMTFFPEALLEYTYTGRLSRRRGNRHSRYAPQGCYPSQGNDMWLALSVRSDEEWLRFCRAVGRQEWDHDRFRSEEGRTAYHDELDRLVSDWTSLYDHHEAAAILQAAGVPAAPVLANWEMLSNHHFHDRGFYIPIAHPEMGVFPYPGMPWKLSDTPGVVRRASPTYGEHNDLVFRKLLKLGDDEIRELYEKGIAAHAPPEGTPL